MLITVKLSGHSGFVFLLFSFSVFFPALPFNSHLSEQRNIIFVLTLLEITEAILPPFFYNYGGTLFFLTSHPGGGKKKQTDFSESSVNLAVIYTQAAF